MNKKQTIRTLGSIESKQTKQPKQPKQSKQTKKDIELMRFKESYYLNLFVPRETNE